MQFHAIPCIIANVTKKHVSEDDILFTNTLAGKGLNVKSNSTIIEFFFS